MAATTQTATRAEDRPDTFDFVRDVVRVGPGTLAGRYLRSFWQPIYRAQDLAPGRALPLKVMGEDFTLYRGEFSPSPLEGEEPALSLPKGRDGGERPPSPALPLKGGGSQSHLLAFRCAHRGTQLSTGWVEGDDLRCFYHGWKYDGSGQCIEQPAEPEPFCQRIKIRSYPVQEYLGLIFAYLGEGEPPPMRRLLEFEAEGVLVNTKSGVWPCNYFNRLENSPDPIHLAFVHRSSPFADSGLVGIPQVSGHETEYGIEIRAQRPNGKVRVSHFHMPNSTMNLGSDTDDDAGHVLTFAWRIPVNDENTVSYSVSHLALTGEAAERYRAGKVERRGGVSPPTVLAERVLRGELTVDEVTERDSIVNVEDYVAQVGQSAIAPREEDHLGRSDLLVVVLRQLWERELRALAEGRPLKQWRRPARLPAEYGA